MKRKVIQLAGKTSVVSLPCSWIRQFGIKKGDELNIEECGKDLVVKSGSSETEIKKISLNIDRFSERTLRYCVSALHKAGYDEITLTYSEVKFGDTINHLIQSLLLGFVVIEQNSKKIVLKNVANEIDTEFDSALRRTFLVTLSLADSSLELVSLNKFSGLNSLLNLENSNNQLTSFCLRLMNKGFYKEKDKKLFLATIVWCLEKIGDEYKNICVNLNSYDKKISNDLILLYKEVNELFRSYYELFYRFSAEMLNELVDKRREIHNRLIRIKTSNESETSLLISLEIIASKTSDLSSSIFGLNYDKL